MQHSYFIFEVQRGDISQDADVTMKVVASQITGNSNVCSTVCLSAHQRKTSNLHVTGVSDGNPPLTGGFSSHKGPSTRKIFPFDGVIRCGT